MTVQDLAVFSLGGLDWRKVEKYWTADDPLTGEPYFVVRDISGYWVLKQSGKEIYSGNHLYAAFCEASKHFSSTVLAKLEHGVHLEQMAAIKILKA